MLRLSPSLILRHPHVTKSPLVSRLIPAIGDLESAQRELKWLREGSEKQAPASKQEQHHLLEQYVSRRSKGEPIQYILGTTFFNDLELKCRPGVLIPRPETAAAVSYLVELLLAARAGEGITSSKSSPATSSAGRAATHKWRRNVQKKESKIGSTSNRPSLRVFDLCCGSGCIPLLFWHEFYNGRSKELIQALPYIEFLGFDVSLEALELARENQKVVQEQHGSSWAKASESLQNMKFIQANVLRSNSTPGELTDITTLRQALGEHIREKLREKQSRRKSIMKDGDSNDIWISNPPYISEDDYQTTTSASVRDFEPKLALVPPETKTTKTKIVPKTGHDADRFYQDILSQAVESGAQVVLFEVSDLQQAKRVARFAVGQNHWRSVEIWRDNPKDTVPLQYIAMDHKTVTVRGSGEGRSVLVYTRKGAALISRQKLELSSKDATKAVKPKVSRVAAQRQRRTLLSTRKGPTPLERRIMA